MESQQYTTERLILRQWKETDVDPFCRLNADPRVMEFFPATLTTTETIGMVRRIKAHFAQHGFGLWAIEFPGKAEFIGFVGLQIPRFEAPFTPCVEIGWRLDSRYWGQGIATEAALMALQVGFHQFALEEIVSMTATINRRSRRVMEKIGMSYCAKEDFDHPKVPEYSPLQRHVLYRMPKSRYLSELKE